LAGGIAIVVARWPNHERFKARILGVWFASITVMLITGLMMWNVWFPLLYGARITIGAVISMQGIPLLEIPVFGIMYTAGYLLGRLKSTVVE
jgi:predicted tellurium resistance membrane protein TerC